MLGNLCTVFFVQCILASNCLLLPKKKRRSETSRNLYYDILCSKPVVRAVFFLFNINMRLRYIRPEIYKSFKPGNTIFGSCGCLDRVKNNVRIEELKIIHEDREKIVIFQLERG
jgi:hypothetical protein